MMIKFVGKAKNIYRKRFNKYQTETEPIIKSMKLV